MSGEPVSGRPRKRTPEEAAWLVAAYESGALSRRDFCRKHGLAVSTLDAYRSGRRQSLAGKGEPARWVAVEAQEAKPLRAESAGSGLAVVLGQGRRIEVSRGFDAGTLAELLGALERV
jgi:hypothetical protein